MEVLTPPRTRGVVGRVEIDSHHREDRPQEALRVAHGHPEDEPARQRSLDRVIRTLLLCVGSRDQDSIATGIGNED